MSPRFVVSAAILGTCLALAAGSSHAQDGEFEAAVRLYKQGRWSHAFGKFVALANQGDADAAHIALFMSRYGPQLYGSHWEPHPTDITVWSRLIRDRQGNRLNVVVADPYQLARAGTRSAQASRQDPASVRR